MPQYNVADLNKLFDDAKSNDKEVYAEMRSNILLSAGEHFTRNNRNYWNRVRTSGDLNASTNENQRIRITKNWLHKFLRLYVNSILSRSPGTTVMPQNPTELQDQKAAELNEKVWKWMKLRHRFKKLNRNMVDDFCRIGECAVKIFFNPEGGDLKGYEATLDEDGYAVMDEQGQPVPDMEKPVFKGEMVFERIYAHHITRDAAASSMDAAEWIGTEKLEPLAKMQKMYADQPDKLSALVESSDEYVIFDQDRMGYSREKDHVSVREFYFRPSIEYPKGYFYLSTEAGILEEGELPFGIFPFFWCGFDEHPTRARATGFIKVARPWQAEINRASSQTAQHQVTLSDDKILYQAGSKVAQGTLLPGVRGLTYQGTAPTILPGRTGQQYYEYVDRQVAEMGDALMINEISAEKVSNLDPFTLLYRSMKEQSHFSFYTDKYGDYLVDLTSGALELAKHYLSDEDLAEAIGKDELVNVAEFRTSKSQHNSIKVEQSDETLESRMGRQLTTTQILQYVGKQLSPDNVGKLIKNLPFGNWESDFENLTMNETNVENDFLSMERGQMPPIAGVDDSDFILKSVATRMKRRDYMLLPPQVQQMYKQYEQIHIQKKAQEQQALKAAESELIPTGGAMVACDMYVPQEDPKKAPKRVRIPYESVDWLVNILTRQGKTMEKMEDMNQAQLAQISQMIGGGQQAAPQSLPPSQPRQGLPI